MVFLSEMPKDPFNGFGVGVWTQLQQLVVIDELIRAHKIPLWIDVAFSGDVSIQ
jgi:hypothetical protein